MSNVEEKIYYLHTFWKHQYESVGFGQSSRSEIYYVIFGGVVDPGECRLKKIGQVPNFPEIGTVAYGKAGLAS